MFGWATNPKTMFGQPTRKQCLPELPTLKQCLAEQPTLKQCLAEQPTRKQMFGWRTNPKTMAYWAMIIQISSLHTVCHFAIASVNGIFSSHSPGLLFLIGLFVTNWLTMKQSEHYYWSPFTLIGSGQHKSRENRKHSLREDKTTKKRTGNLHRKLATHFLLTITSLHPGTQTW